MLLRFGNPLLLVNIDYIYIENRILLLFTYRWYCYDLQLIQLNTVCFRVKVTTVKANEAISLRQWLWNKYIFIRVFFNIKGFSIWTSYKNRNINSLAWSHIFENSVVNTTTFSANRIFHSVACWLTFLYTYW